MNDRYVSKLAKPTRKRDIADQRAAAMNILRKEEGMTLAEIGQLFHRHHSTVLASIKKCRDLQHNEDFIKVENKVKTKLFS